MNGYQEILHRIGRNIKAIRKQNRLTQAKLAQLLYCDERNIRRIEKEGTNSLQTIELIAQVLKVSSQDIIYGVL